MRRPLPVRSRPQVSPFSVPAQADTFGLQQICQVFKTKTELGGASGDVNEGSLGRPRNSVVFIRLEILQHMAIICINDMRSIPLVHHKRMLGILLEELPSLQEAGHITAEEALALHNGIVPTIIPGSSSMQQVLTDYERDPTLKHRYFPKAARLGWEQNQIRGLDLSQAEWLEHFRRLQKPLRPSEHAYVVERYINQVWYDIVRQDVEVPEKSHLVGSYYAMKGGFAGTGSWRLGDDRLLVKLNAERRGVVMSGLNDR